MNAADIIMYNPSSLPPFLKVSRINCLIIYSILILILTPPPPHPSPLTSHSPPPPPPPLILTPSLTRVERRFGERVNNAFRKKKKKENISHKAQTMDRILSRKANFFHKSFYSLFHVFAAVGGGRGGGGRG